MQGGGAAHFESPARRACTAPTHFRLFHPLVHKGVENQDTGSAAEAGKTDDALGPGTGEKRNRDASRPHDPIKPKKELTAIGDNHHDPVALLQIFFHKKRGCTLDLLPKFTIGARGIMVKGKCDLAGMLPGPFFKNV